MYSNSKDKTKQNGLLVVCIVLFLCCSILEIRYDLLTQFFFNEHNKFITACLVTVIGSQIQLFLSVMLALKCEKKGYIASIILCFLTICGACFSVFFYQQLFEIIGFVCSIMTGVVSTVIDRQIYVINSNAHHMQCLVFEDDLTELPNRKRILSSLSNRTANDTIISYFSLIFIDLDEFKLVNDMLGHQVGDIFIKEVAHNLQGCLEKDDFLGRMGGDEFAIIVPGEHTAPELNLYAQKLAAAISTPFIYRNKEIKISATFGIAQYPKDGDNATELLQHADMAMYRGKAQGKGRVMFFDEEIQETIEKRLNIQTQLHSAIEHNELYLEYQPQYEPVSHKLRGLEALARWISPMLGHVSPVEFIPIAEEDGDIVPIGKWILERACTQYMEMYESYEIPPFLSVNISAAQFHDPDFLESIKRIIKKTNMDVDHLELEITESVCIMSPEIITAVFAELKNMGVQIAMDDFGTGYSSLSYLRNLPLDVVKIDTAFTKTILSTPTDQNIIKTIIIMAHQLHLKVIAEGVEENEQLEYLVNNGCDYIQGNLFGRPVPIDAL